MQSAGEKQEITISIAAHMHEAVIQLKQLICVRFSLFPFHCMYVYLLFLVYFPPIHLYFNSTTALFIRNLTLS